MLATPELIQEAAMPYKLAALVPRWLKEVPLYSRRHYPLPSQSDAIPLGQLKQWPTITKRDIREGFPGNFLRDEAELDRLISSDTIELEHTSGTSEPRIPLLLGRGWWAEQEARALRLNTFIADALRTQTSPRRVILSSPMCNNDICYTGVPSRDERIVGDSLSICLSRFPFLWSDRDLERMAEETEDWAPDFLDMDPVYGVAFARYCERNDLRFPSLRFIIASYEFLSCTHRRYLEHVFKVPVFNLYGSTETGHLLMQTTAGDMRPSYETAWLEIVDEQNGIGDLVVTTLSNEFMPLLRYRIGDLVERLERPYGPRYIVHGRAADAFRSGDGGRCTVWQVDQCFSWVTGVAHYQLSEKLRGEFLLRYVEAGAGQGPVDVQLLRDRLEKLLGPGAKVVAEKVDLLMPESSGKFRLCYPAVS